MDLVSFFEKMLRRRGGAVLLLLFAFACSSPKRRPPEGVGFGDVFQEIRWEGGRLESPALHVGSLRIPLAGPLFRLEFRRLGALGPEDFEGNGLEGLGTARLQARFAGKKVPLEVVVRYRVRLEDPSFEKTLQVRWLGLPSRAPFLEKVLVQAVPWEGGKRPLPGRPCSKAGLCAALAVPWGRARKEGGLLFLEEMPRVSLQGGWWRSSPAVLCPSGSFPAELAFLRWTAHERGARRRLLFFRGLEGGGDPPKVPRGFSCLPLRQVEGQKLAGRFSPGMGAGRRSKRPGKRPRKGGLALLFPPGTRAESILFRKALQVALGPGEGGEALVFQGVDSRGNPLALRDALSLFRALSPGGKVFLGWDRKGPVSPFWQAFLDGQDGLDPARDGPLLGQATASLDPWRSKGEAWGRALADRLVWELARGGCALDLGWIPPAGKEGRRFLQAALAWAAREESLIRNVHTPFAGEPGFGVSGENWVALEGGRLLWARRGGKGGAAGILPGKKWKWVLLVYPERRILSGRGKGGEDRAFPGRLPGKGVLLLEAWLKGKEPPTWVRAWASGGNPPAGAILPPLFGGGNGRGGVSPQGASGPPAGLSSRPLGPGNVP